MQSRPNFNGTDGQYKWLHTRIGNMFGRPMECEKCSTLEAPKYEWANISGKYTELREDWIRLCAKCHRRMDAKLYIGKRFTGGKHTPETLKKISEASKRTWATKRDKMMAKKLAKKGLK